jgi:trehalose 6-phosphate phosphatase
VPDPDPLTPLREAPEESALVLDVDGTLAPIAETPDSASVPEATKAELRRLVGRYLLIACLSGRAGEDAHRLVGVEGVQVVGNHGLELDPRAPSLAGEIAGFRAEVGLPVEDKHLSLSYHFRQAADHEEARRELESVAERARAAGLVPRWGRKVLEIRPALPADKGTAVRALIERAGARRALYAGDDATDLDAFAGLVAAGLDHAVRVAVASEEGPDELLARAEVVVEGPAELAALLATL